MKKIPLDAKIFSISHNDLDGTVAQIVLGHVYDNITFLNTSFYKIDSILESLEYDKYDYVILTDIHPDLQQNLYLSDKIILLDHHESAEEYTDPSKMHYVIPGICGAKLTLRFVEKMYDIKLDHLRDLVEMTNDYDMWILNDPKSKQMNDVMFYLYRPNKFRDKFFDGRTTFTEEEEAWLEERAIKFEKIYNNLTAFEFDKLNGCIAQSREFINEICDRLMNEEGYNIIFVRNPSTERVSVRHRIEGLNAGEILKTHGWGGGHAESAGFFTTDLNDFKMKVKVLEDEIAEKLAKRKE